MKRSSLHVTVAIFIFLYCNLSGYSQSTKENQIIQFQGKKVHILTKNIDSRNENKPIVILESGLGSPIQNWNNLLEKLPDSIPIFAYERAGIGQSEITDMEPSPENTANRLHEILNMQKIEPPYILVGHSWGGVIINSYTVEYPDEVVGLVYIDESDIINMEKNNLEAIKRASDGKVSTNVLKEKMNDVFQQAPPGLAKEWKEIYKLTGQKEIDSLKFTPPKTIPTAILVAGKYSPPPVDLGIKTFDLKDYHKEIVKLRVEKFATKIMDNPNGIFLQLNNLGHYMHVENPELVSNIIEEIYDLSK